MATMSRWNVWRGQISFGFDYKVFLWPNSFDGSCGREEAQFNCETSVVSVAKVSQLNCNPCRQEHPCPFQFRSQVKGSSNRLCQGGPIQLLNRRSKIRWLVNTSWLQSVGHWWSSLKSLSCAAHTFISCLCLTFLALFKKCLPMRPKIFGKVGGEIRYYEQCSLLGKPSSTKSDVFLHMGSTPPPLYNMFKK